MTHEQIFSFVYNLAALKRRLIESGQFMDPSEYEPILIAAVPFIIAALPV